MPILVPTSELQEGMRLDRPLLQHGRVLMAARKELTATDIALLIKRFPDLQIAVVDPHLDEFVEFQDEAPQQRALDAVRRQIGGCMQDVQERFGRHAALQVADIARARQAVEDVMKYLEAHPVSAGLLKTSLDHGGYLAQHAGNVFYLSMMLASAVRGYVVEERQRQTLLKDLRLPVLQDLTPLGLGAMFMDLAMLPLQGLFTKSGALTDEEIQQIRMHPLQSAEMLPESFPSVARMVIKTHHENFDGTGYPGGWDRDRLHVFGRIVRIADAFDAATSVRVFREAKSPVRALWEMSVGPYRRFYDPVLMKVFAHIIQPYPIGAKLRLTDGRFAVVVKYNERWPFHPYVVIAFDRDNQRLPADRIEGPLSLQERRDLHVAYWGEENVCYVYGQGGAECEPVRTREIKTLFTAAYP